METSRNVWFSLMEHHLTFEVNWSNFFKFTSVLCHLDNKSAVTFFFPSICLKFKEMSAQVMKIFLEMVAKSSCLVLPVFKTYTTASLSKKWSFFLFCHDFAQSRVATKILKC